VELPTPPRCTNCDGELSLTDAILSLVDGLTVHLFKCSICDRLAAFVSKDGELREL
jgi:hypothetical protein